MLLRSIWLSAIPLVAFGVAAPHGEEASRRVTQASPRFDFPEMQHTVFLAVLEGLYRDAVPVEAVDLVLAPDATGEFANFVLRCPICTPAREAFRTYRTRPEIEGFKGPFFSGR